MSAGPGMQARQERSPRHQQNNAFGSLQGTGHPQLQEAAPQQQKAATASGQHQLPPKHQAAAASQVHASSLTAMPWNYACRRGFSMPHCLLVADNFTALPAHSHRAPCTVKDPTGTAGSPCPLPCRSKPLHNVLLQGLHAQAAQQQPAQSQQPAHQQPPGGAHHQHPGTSGQQQHTQQTGAKPGQPAQQHAQQPGGRPGLPAQSTQQQLAGTGKRPPPLREPTRTEAGFRVADGGRKDQPGTPKEAHTITVGGAYYNGEHQILCGYDWEADRGGRCCLC